MQAGVLQQSTRMAMWLLCNRAKFTWSGRIGLASCRTFAHDQMPESLLAFLRILGMQPYANHHSVLLQLLTYYILFFPIRPAGGSCVTSSLLSHPTHHHDDSSQLETIHPIRAVFRPGDVDKTRKWAKS